MRFRCTVSYPVERPWISARYYRSFFPQPLRGQRRARTEPFTPGIPLTPAEQEVALAVGVSKPELVRIEIVESLPLPEDPVLRAAALQAGLLGLGMVGLTLGHAIFICRGHKTRRLLSHELRHVHQYEQHGSIAAFLPVYLGQIVEAGYGNAPLEADARAHELREG